MVDINDEEWKLIFDNINAYVNTEALNAACDMDLFTVLNKYPGLSLVEISNKLSISCYSARVLMLCCCNTGLIIREKLTGKYYNSSVANKLLDSRKPFSILGYVKFNQNIQKPSLSNFINSLITNKNAGIDAFPGKGNTLYERLASYPKLEKIFQDGLGSYSSCLSTKLLLISEFKNRRKVLDLAGGDATIEILLCNKFPNLKFTILELPSICKLTNKKLQLMSFSKKIHCAPIDVFDGNWPNGFDTIFASHFIEIFPPDKIKLLYTKISKYLPKNGMFILWTATSNDSEDKGLQSAKSSMYFLTTASGGGYTYPLSEHIKWLMNAGLHIKNIYSFENIEHTAIVAVKP